MSNEKAKFLNSRRRHKTDVAIARQLKIAKAHGLTNRDQSVRQPHRLAKHHTMDCGNPHCYLCGNPRKTHKDKLTAQEKRLFQDLDKTSDKHSNGLPSQDNDE
jgi:protein subunit release factor B